MASDISGTECVMYDAAMYIWETSYMVVVYEYDGASS